MVRTHTRKRGKYAVSLSSCRIEEDEGYCESAKDDNVHPVARWETFEDQSIQHGKNTQNSPDDLHLNHDLHSIPHSLSVGEP